MASIKGDGKAIFAAFLIGIVAVVLIASASNNIHLYTTHYTQVNGTYTAAAANSSTALTGRNLVGTAVITNATNATQAAITQLRVASGIGSDGLMSVLLYTNDTAAAWVGQSVNVTYTYEPDGYLQGSGSRAFATLIILMGSLAILVSVLVVFLKDGSLGKYFRKG